MENKKCSKPPTRIPWTYRNPWDINGIFFRDPWNIETPMEVPKSWGWSKIPNHPVVDDHDLVNPWWFGTHLKKPMDSARQWTASNSWNMNCHWEITAWCWEITTSSFGDFAKNFCFAEKTILKRQTQSPIHLIPILVAFEPKGGHTYQWKRRSPRVITSSAIKKCYNWI